MKPYISIILCSYNGQRCLKRTLDNILRQKSLEEIVKEIILVDNHSSDQTAAIMQNAEKRSKLIKYVQEPVPGLSQARLCGFNHTSGEWIAFIDDDNYLEELWIQKLDSHIKRYKEVGIFGGSIIPYMDFQMTSENELVLNVFYQSLAITELTEDNVSKEDITIQGTVYGAGMAVNRKVLEKLKKSGWLKMKGRTGKNLSSGEDTEICFLAKRMGYQIARINGMLIRHDIPQGRLEISYAKSLMTSLCEAIFILSNRDSKWFLRRIQMIGIIVNHKIKKYFLRKSLSEQEKFEQEINEIYDTVIFNQLLSVHFIRRL